MMASGGAEEEDEGISLDIDDVLLLLHVEQEQIQKRTFTKWINAQLAKRTPPSRVSDLFDDLKDGSVLLDLLEVITGQPMIRQRIHGVFQQRADIETALNFLRNRSVKLVNINIPDIIDGNPAIILGLIWTIIQNFHIGEIATSLSSEPSTQPSLHNRLGLSAKQTLLTWAQNQCHRVSCSVSITDFTSSWRSGEAFLAILCSLRPELVDLTQVKSRTSLENLEYAFELAERELHIPRLLEPQDVDVPDPDEKSIMTFVAQFLRFSIESSSPVVNSQQPVLNVASCKEDLKHKELPNLLQMQDFKKGPGTSQKAKRRLEKTRAKVQTCIQQAIELFSNRDITEAEARRKERALKALEPALLEDFLSAVDTYGGFCSERLELEGLKLLSESVRNQWEDVRTEMSAYIDMLWSMIWQRKQHADVRPSEKSTNIDHEERQLQKDTSSVRSRHKQDGTGIMTNLQPKHQSTSHEQVQSASSTTIASDKTESADDDILSVSESINKIVSKPVTDISSKARAEPSVPVDKTADTQAHSVKVTQEKSKTQEENLIDVDVQFNQKLDLKIDVSERVKDFKKMENGGVAVAKPKKTRKNTSESKPEETLGSRRTVLLGKLMDLQTATEEVGLQEVTLPALHQRSRALMKLEHCLSDLQSEFEHIKTISKCCGANVKEVEDLWEVTTKAISERLEQCGDMAELLKRFQKTSADVGESMNKAECIVKDQASYMGRDNLHKLHTKVTETKSELNNLDDGIGELRSVSKQLHSHLLQIPQCTSNIPFESEAQSLMDHWLDISERVESHFENLHLALTLWDNALKLGLEVDHWTSTKLNMFAHCPILQSEEDIQALQAEVRAHEESITCFSRITAEIQTLIQTAEPPLELQVGEVQMKKRMSELKEIVSEAEEVFRQTEAAKTNVSDRMCECVCSLHTVHQALFSLSGPDPAAVLSELEDLYLQLEAQAEEVLTLHEDLRVLGSVGRLDSVKALYERGHTLQETLSQVQQLYTEVDEQIHRDIQLYHRLQTQVEQFKQRLSTDEDACSLQEEDPQLRLQSLSQLVLLVRKSTFYKSPLVEESRELLAKSSNGKTSSRGGPRDLHESPNFSQSCFKAADQPDARLSEVCAAQRGTSAKIPAGDSGNTDDMKDEVQEIQKVDDVWSAQLCHLLNNDLQVPPKPNNMREECILRDSHWFELQSCLSLLQAQLHKVSVSGGELCSDEGLRRTLQDCCHKLTLVQGVMSRATPGSVQKAVLQQLTTIEKILYENTVSMEPNTGLSQEIHKLLHLKRALDDSVKAMSSHEEKVQSEGQSVEAVSNEESIKSVFQSVKAEDWVIDTGTTNGRRHQPHQNETDQNEPTSNQQSPGLVELISVHKDDSAAPPQPLLPPQNEKKIEIQEPLSSVENPISAAPGNDLNRRLQKQNLVTCPVDVQKTHTIVQDSQRKIHKESTKYTGGYASAKESTAASFKEDETDFCNIDDATYEGEKLHLDGIGGLLKKLCKLQLPGSSEDTTNQVALEMEPENMGGSDDTCGSGEVTAEASGESSKHKFTMRDVLEGVKSLVENSCIINRAPRLDLKWFLKSLPGEAEIQLMQTIRRVFKCRYQPTQPNLTDMTRQLQEAESLKCCVQEKVDAINHSAESDAPNGLESLCSAALLDASATVQLKATQLHQIKQYHRQLKLTKAFLAVVTTQKEKMNLETLGNSELLAEQLNALLKTMDHKKSLIDDLVKLSQQLSSNLNCTDNSGFFCACITDIQEDWTRLEQNIKTSLQHASYSVFQLSTFRQGTKALKSKLDEVFISMESFVNLPNFKNTWYLLTWTADLEIYMQQYAHLWSRFDDIQMNIGQTDKDQLKKDLEKLRSLLNETKMKFGNLTRNCGRILSSNLQLQDLIRWAKQQELHIFAGEELSLFPEEAQIQIAELEKIQRKILCRQIKIQDFKFQEVKTVSKEEYQQVRQAMVDLYQNILTNLSKCIVALKDNLKDRETLFSQLASLDAWIAETRAKTDYFGHVENIQQIDKANIEKQSKIHIKNTIETESRLKVVDVLEESCKEILVGLSNGETSYLVNRLAGIRTEICGILAHEKAVVSELEGLMYQWTKFDEKLSEIETNLQNICIDLNKHRFPLTQESISEIRILTYKLTEQQCQVRAMQHYEAAKRTSLLDTIGELLDKCNVLYLCAVEQDKYMQLRRQMEQSMEIINEQITSAKDKTANLGERFKLCQHLLVEMPLVKTQCQEVADQLEAIAQELHPSELNSQRLMIKNTVESLVNWENAVTEDIKNLENKLKLGLRFETELLATTELLLKTKQELQEAKPVHPDEMQIDVRLQKYWVFWRNMESAIRVLEGLARKEKKNLGSNEELYATRNAAMKECLVQMESLSQARECLKDHQWAAQGAAVFLHNAESTFLSSSGGFEDCTEEQRQIQQALVALKDGFQAHVDYLTRVIPKQPCLSRTEMEEVHREILGQLVVRRAVLEAQAQVQLETLQRCSDKHQQHLIKHEDVLRIICALKDNISKCATERTSSYENCVARQTRTKLLFEDLQGLVAQIEELGAVYLMHDCGVERSAEAGALWRKWTVLRRELGLMSARTELKAEELKNITICIEQCRAYTASFQTDLPPHSPGGSSEGEPLALFAQAEVHRTGLEKRSRALASLERCLEHALSSSLSPDPTSPGPLGKTLQDIKDSIRSLMETNRTEVEMAERKEKEKQEVIKKLTELESQVLCLSSTLESCSSQSQQQEYMVELSSHKTRLQQIVDTLHSCYSEVPVDISRLSQDVQLSLQRAEEKVSERSAHAEMLCGRVEELRTGLEKVRELLKQRNPGVSEAQTALKHVWDELDLWHGRLMLLESEVQDFAEDLPDQAHLLIDQLTEPLQCYQDTAQMVEQHTAFLSKIPACLREFENIMYRATCWLDDAESWLGASCSFTTAKSLQNHANSLQLLLDDSERIRLVLQGFRPVLCDIGAVCDMSVQEQRLENTDRNVLRMQQNILQPLRVLLQAATVVEDLEAELKTIEKNVSKMEAILSFEHNGNISVAEDLQNRQVIVRSAQSAKEVLRDMQRVKEELDLPWDSKDKLLVWTRASALLQQIQELELLSQEQPSVLEDPDETIQAADRPTMDEGKQQTDVQMVHDLPFEQDTSLDTTKSWLLSVRPWLDTSASEHMESDLNVENAPRELPISTNVCTVGNQTAVAMDKSGSLKQEAHVFAPAMSRSGIEDTRLVPVRPITPFAAATANFEEGEDEQPSLFESPTEELGTSNEETGKSTKELSLNIQEESDIEEIAWTQLSEEISLMLSRLNKFQQDFQVTRGETVSNGACLQEIQQAVLMLRSTVNMNGSHEHAELCRALKQVVVCLDALSNFVLSSIQNDNDSDLKLLQNECLRGEVGILSELLGQIQTVDDLKTSQCVTSLQECVGIVSERLHLTMGLTQPQQVMSNRVVVMDFLDLKQKSVSQSSEETPNLQSELVRLLRGSPGAGAELRPAAQWLLQGMRALVDVGEEESSAEGQKQTIHSQTELQEALLRLQKFQEVLVSQLAFAEHLLQQEALRGHEEECAQLQVRARAVQRQTLDQQVTFQWNLKEWTRWEGNCVHLGGLLEESEEILSREELKESDAEEMEKRIQKCQTILSKLDESKSILGLLLDQGENLQISSVRQKGGALELQWRDIFRRIEAEIRRSRDAQEHWTSFQTDVASINQWLLGAKEQAQKCSDLIMTSDPKLECVHNCLITLLELYVEVGSMSILKESISRRSRPSERDTLANLETQWSQLTSALCKTQELLQQHLLKRWPPDDTLSALEDWLEKKQTHFNEEKEEKSARLSLQKLKGLKTGLEHGQLLLDSVCQSGPPLVGEEAITLRCDRTMLAEKLGALRLRWVNLQGELEIQINGAEHMHQIQARKQKKLRHLQNLIDQKKKKVDLLTWPCGEYLAGRRLQEWEGHMDSLKDIAADLEELRDTSLNREREHKDCTEDVAFWEQVKTLQRTREEVVQQMETLHPLMQQNLEKWSYFRKHLNELSLYTVRLHCSLHQPRTPVFSAQQAQRHLILLQEFQSTNDKYKEQWDELDKLHQDLVKNDQVLADVVKEEMDRQRKRWKEVLNNLKSETDKTQKSVLMWQEYTAQSEKCSLLLQQAWSDLEGILLHQDLQAKLQSLQEFRQIVEDVESTLERFLVASKPLIGQLDPMASNILQSHTMKLSSDVCILNQTVQVHEKNTQDDMDQLNLFLDHLERLENITKQKEEEIKRIKDADCAKQVFSELSGLFTSMFDVSEMSAHVNLSNQAAQRLKQLQGKYVDSLNHGLNKYKQLHFGHFDYLDFDGKCKALTEIQNKLEQALSSRNPQNYNNLKEMAADHQKLQGDIVVGNILLHGLICDTVKMTENATNTQKSETLAEVSCIQQKWVDLLNLIHQRQSLVKQQLSEFASYQRGLKHLHDIMTRTDSLLPSTVLSVSQMEMQDYEVVEKFLQPHSAVYTRTVDSGRSLCESITDPESQTKLQTDTQALEEAWEHATSQLQKYKEMIHSTLQKWRNCQEKMAELRSELDQCGLQLQKELPDQTKDAEEIIQEAEISLRLLKVERFQEVDSMKTDLSHYVPVGDSSLLEQQLDQLHNQWEELCTKVSLRKQEIADRLNAWTIFNDKNKEFCDWLTQMENKVCHSADLSFEEMVEKLKKDCMEEMNLFSENKRHLKQLGEQLLWASNEAKHSQVHGSLQEATQRWHGLFLHIQDRVTKLKETLSAVQQLDKNMSNLRSWLCRIEAELSRPITYSVLHHQEIHKRLAEHQELQRDIEQHTEGVVSVLSLCDVLLQDQDASSHGTGADTDSLQETSRSLDQRWRGICAMALDRRLRIEETWRLWCKFLDDYSRFEDWLKMAERTAANPNSGDVLYTVAKEELKKFEGFQRQVNERLTQLEIVNNQYRRLARENRTDRASQLKTMVQQGNRRWDMLHRRVGAILRRLRYFTSQREEFESTRESMLVWLTELDLQLTNVEHFSESDVHHKIQQLNSFQKEIRLNTERIDGLIVFGEGLIQRSAPGDAEIIEDELEELHTYCQEVFGRLVRFHHRLSQPPIPAEPESPVTSFSLESSLALIGRPWLGRSLSSPFTTPTRLLTTPLSRSGRETPVSVDSLPLEWDHTGDVGGSSHEDDEDDDLDDEGAYFSAVSSRSVCDSPRWQTQDDPDFFDLKSVQSEAPPTLSSTPLKQGNYLHLMSQCSGSVEDFKRVSLILDEDTPEEFGLVGLNTSGRQSGVIERWELLQAQSQSDLRADPEDEHLPWALDRMSSWLDTVAPQLQHVLLCDPPSSVEDMGKQAKDLKEMQRAFTQYKSTMLSLNLNSHGDGDLHQKVCMVNQRWSQACTDLQHWDSSLRRTLLRCQEFHERLHSLLLWLAHAESRRYALDIHHPETPAKALRQHCHTLTDVQEELVHRQSQHASLHALWSQLQPEHTEESDEAQEKLHVTGQKMRILLKELNQDLITVQHRLEKEPGSDEQDQRASSVPSESKKKPPNARERREPAQHSFFYRLLRAAFPLHLLLLLLLLMPCLVPLSPPEHGCTGANNFARSFYPMLHYTNGPPPT